jgi:urease gamma subunit
VDFLILLRRAKAGDGSAVEELLELYSPLLYKESVVNGVLDEDLLQELRIVFLICLQKFRIGI